MTVGALRPLGPGVLLRESLRKMEPLGERVAARLVVGDAAADVVDADTLDPWRRPLEIACFLSVKLDEGGAIMQRLLLGLDLAQDVGHADSHSAVAADMQLVAAVDAD